MIDAGRLRRAVHLTVTEAGLHQWRVDGGRRPHVVTFAEGRLACDCRDQEIRGGSCKHILAVQLHRQLTPPLREALRAIVPAKAA